MKIRSAYYYANTLAIIIFATAASSSDALAQDAENQNLEAFGTAVPDTALANNRGGYTTQTSTNNLDATLDQNQALANVTGNNSVASGAFTDTSGFATVVQNSGNNVIIQNSTILNLELK